MRDVDQRVTYAHRLAAGDQVGGGSMELLEDRKKGQATNFREMMGRCRRLRLVPAKLCSLPPS